VLCGVVLLVVAGCSSGSSGPGKYEQTWRTSYASTTCADWQRELDGHERWVAAGDMLTAARSDDVRPSDDLIDSFAKFIASDCTEISPPTRSIAAVAAQIYAEERQIFAK
jgi:hypothetical protein